MMNYISAVHLYPSTEISSHTVVELEEDKDDDSNEDSIVSKQIGSHHLWAIFLTIRPSSNRHKFISSFLFLIPCSNAYVESVFSTMKHSYDDQRNQMSADLTAAELKTRLNSSLSCV